MIEAQVLTNLKTLYRRSFPENTRQQIRNTIKFVRGTRANPKAQINRRVTTSFPMKKMLWRLAKRYSLIKRPPTQPINKPIKNSIPEVIRLAGELHAAGRLEEALLLSTEAVHRSPKSGSALRVHARILIDMGRLNEVPGLSRAEAKALVKIAANAKMTLIAEAKELAAAWRLGDALAKVNASLSIAPSQAAYRLRATILAQMGDKVRAVEANRELLALNPLDIAGYRQLRALGEELPPVSMEIALEAVNCMGGTSTAYLRAAECLYFFGIFDAVLQVCEMGLAVAEAEKEGERRAKTLYNLLLHKGYALEAMHRHEQALSLYQAMSSGTFEERSVVPIARCLLELGQPEKGEAILRRAYVGGPDPQPFSPLTMDLLQAKGDIREAYALYRKRPISLALAKTFKAEKHPLDLYILSEEYRNKKALILAEGGPADELRMCSVYGELASCFDHLTITCEPRLQSIMERNFPDITFLPTARHRREIVKDMSDRSTLTDARLFQLVSDQVIIAAKDANLVCSLLDTLADLRPDREAFRRTKRAPLKPDPALKKHWKARTKVGGRPSVGLSWRSMLQSVARDRHYLTVNDLAPLADVDADFWLFQPGATQEEIEHLRSFLTLHIPEDLDLVNDMEGQLALAANLDYVISPFATAGELAGAVGTPTFLVSTSISTTWRRNPDGSDIWHAKTQIVWGNPIHDRVSAMQVVADQLKVTPASRGKKRIPTSHPAQEAAI